MIKKVRKAVCDYIPAVLKSWAVFRIPSLYEVFRIKTTSATIMLTNRCNLKCVMCGLWREPDSERELNTDEWIKVLTDLKSEGIKNVHLSGGEPLLLRDIGSIIEWASNNGFVVGMTTNGTLLTEERLNVLLKSGIRSIAVSVDALDDGYESIRGVTGAFAKVKTALELVAQAKKASNIDAYVNFTLMKDNLKDLKEVKGMADGLGLPLAVNLLDSTSAIFDVEDNKKAFWIDGGKGLEELKLALAYLRAEKAKKPSSLLLTYPAIDFIERYFKDPVIKDIPCVASQDRIIIDPHGGLMGGCMSMGIFGNLTEKKFSELRKEPKYKKARKAMFYKKCRGCSCGYYFNIRHMPWFIVKDLGQKVSKAMSGVKA